MENNSTKENGSGLKQRLAELAKHYQQVEVEDVSSSSSASKSSSAISISNSTNIASNTPKSPQKASNIASRFSGRTPITNTSSATKVPSSTTRTPSSGLSAAKTPTNTPAFAHANNQPLPDECAAAAIANRPVSKVAALWEQRCREEAAQVSTLPRLSNKRRSRSGSPCVGQVSKRAVNIRAYSPASTPNDDSSSTGDYQTAASTSESDQIPPPVPPPLHAAPTVILNQQPQQPYYGSHQRSSSNVQEMRLDFESKLAALGFEMVGGQPPGQGGGIAAVSLASPVMVRAEPAVGVASSAALKAETQTVNRLPPSGASRSNVRPSPAQKKRQQASSSDDDNNSEDDRESTSDGEDIDQLVTKARQQVDEVVRQEISEEMSEGSDDEDEDEQDGDEEDEIVPMPPPPPPPRGRSFGGGTYISDVVSTDSTSAWNSMEDIHAAALDRRRSDNGTGQIEESEEDDEDEEHDANAEAIDSLSFASSSEETSESQSTEKNQPIPNKLTSRKSSAKEPPPKKEAWVEERERDLKRQLIIQDGVIQQTMKALLECQARRQEHLASAKKKSKLGGLFSGATKVEPLSANSGHSGCTVGSLAEAEFYRVLLIANERRKAIHSELRRLSSRRAPTIDSTDILPVTVTISDIQLQLKHEFRMRQINTGESELYYFVVLLRHGPTVLHTVCIGTDEARDGCIQFPNMLQFSDVRAFGGGEGETRDNELNMKISIYGLTLPRDVPASYDVSSKHRKTGSHHHHHGSVSPNPSSQIQTGTGISTPFYCVDSASITREIVRQAATSPRGLASVSLHCMPSKWPLMPSVKFRARCALSAPIEHTGFLTLFTNASPGSLPAWHRRWAHLRTTEIYFYAEPDAEPSNPSPPLPCFDLHNVSPSCSSAEVLTQHTCARPNTLELILNCGGSTSSATSSSSVTSGYDNHQSRLWFAADTRADLYEWRICINRALSAIKLWGLVGTNNQQQTQTQVSGSGSSKTTLGGDSDQQQPLQSRL